MFFSENELKCKCGQCEFGQHDIDPFFMSKLIDLRMDAGFPFKVYSAYRCPYWDAQVGGKGPHLGHAIDLGVYGHQANYIVSRAKHFGFTGVGVKQHGPYKSRFIHLDDLHDSKTHRRPWIWSYS